MKTKRIKIYTFSELSQEAKQKAVDHFIKNDIVDSCEIDDFKKSIEVFAEITNLRKDYSNSVLGYSTSWIDDDILNLSGARLASYIWNNYGSYFWKGKYYFLYSKTEKNDSGTVKVKIRYSKVIKEQDYALTGYYSDSFLLQPFYDFIDGKKNFLNTTLKDLLNESIQDLQSGFEQSEDERYSFAAVSDLIECNDYEFLKDGTIFNF